jgi:hypothetical protein
MLVYNIRYLNNPDTPPATLKVEEEDAEQVVAEFAAKGCSVVYKEEGTARDYDDVVFKRG